MNWLAWTISGMGAVFLASAVYGQATCPHTPQDAVRTHRAYRVWLPLVLAWVFLWGKLPDALHAPWPIDAASDVIALGPVR